MSKNTIHVVPEEKIRSEAVGFAAHVYDEGAFGGARGRRVEIGCRPFSVSHSLACSWLESLFASDAERAAWVDEHVHAGVLAGAFGRFIWFGDQAVPVVSVSHFVGGELRLFLFGERPEPLEQSIGRLRLLLRLHGVVTGLPADGAPELAHFRYLNAPVLTEELAEYERAQALGAQATYNPAARAFLPYGLVIRGLMDEAEYRCALAL